MRALTLVALVAAALPAWPAQPEPAAPPGRGANSAAEDKAATDAALQLYRAMLLQSAMQRRGYPAQALARRLSGAVDIEITVGADGKLQHETLIGSSGHTLLDEDALGLLQLAVPLTAIPPALVGRAFRLTVSVNYAIPE